MNILGKLSQHFCTLIFFKNLDCIFTIFSLTIFYHLRQSENLENLEKKKETR